MTVTGVKCTRLVQHLATSSVGPRLVSTCMQVSGHLDAPDASPALRRGGWVGPRAVLDDGEEKMIVV